MSICDNCRLQDNCSQESDSGYCVHYEAEPPEVAFVREMSRMASGNPGCSLWCRQCKSRDDCTMYVTPEDQQHAVWPCRIVAQMWEAHRDATE